MHRRQKLSEDRRHDDGGGSALGGTQVRQLLLLLLLITLPGILCQSGANGNVKVFKSYGTTVSKKSVLYDDYKLLNEGKERWMGGHGSKLVDDKQETFKPAENGDGSPLEETYSFPRNSSMEAGRKVEAILPVHPKTHFLAEKIHRAGKNFQNHEVARRTFKNLTEIFNEFIPKFFVPLNMKDG
jgi:hypothetical protein